MFKFDASGRGCEVPVGFCVVGIAGVLQIAMRDLGLEVQFRQAQISSPSVAECVFGTQ